MRQAIHIFRKDVRHLWPAILAVMILTALFAYVGSVSIPVILQGSSSLDQYNTLLQFVMPVSWWCLIAAAIHEEALPGHQQFWLTRPYSWKSLLAAKWLFIIAFVNVPKLLADCVILQVQGFHIASYWPNLIAWQILFTAVWLLPYAALATITRNLRQFSLTVLMTWLVIVFLPGFVSVNSPLFVFSSGSSFGGDWIRYFVILTILLIASLLILLWQYSRRRTAASRMTAVFAAILVLVAPLMLSVPTVRAIQSRWLSSHLDASIRMGIDPNRKRGKEMGTTNGLPGTIQIDIPVEIAPLEQGKELYTADINVEIEGPDGKRSPAAAAIVQLSDGFWQKIFVPLPVFQQLKQEEITLHTSGYFSLLGDQATTQIEPGERGTEVPGLGRCRLSQRGDNWVFACVSPFRRSSLFAKTLLSIPGTSFVNPGSDSPFPAAAGINPLVVSVSMSGSTGSVTKADGSTSAGPQMAVTIITERLMAHSRCDIEIRGVRLGDYAIKE